MFTVGIGPPQISAVSYSWPIHLSLPLGGGNVDSGKHAISGADMRAVGFIYHCVHRTLSSLQP